MKKIAILTIIGSMFAAYVFAADLRVFVPQQGGTGIGSATSSDVGKVLTVSSTSPFAYRFDSASSGSVGPSTSTYIAVFNATNTIDGYSTFNYASSTNTLTLPTSTVVTGLTNGSLLFATSSGLISQDNSNLYWDDANNRIGIGTTAPSSSVHSVKAAPSFQLTDTNAGGTNINIRNGGLGLNYFDIFDVGSSTSRFVISGAGNVGIGTATPGRELHISADASGSGDAIFRISPSTASQANGASMEFQDGGTVQKMTVGYGSAMGGSFNQNIGGIVANNLSSGLNFTTNAGAYGLVIKANNVGIGTSAPAAALDIGTSATGLNAAVNATLGTELAPALTTGNWTLGTGWQFLTSPNKIDKNADGTGTVTPTAATNIVSGNTYKVVIVVDSVSVTYANVSMGGQNLTALAAATTYTDYVTAVGTNKLVITPNLTGLRITISSISITEVTNNTGELTAYGGVQTTAIKDIGTGTDAIRINPVNIYIPRGITTTGNFISTGVINTSAAINAGAASAIYWGTRSTMYSPANGNIKISDFAGTDFGLLQFGGVTSAYPALKRSAANLQIIAADGASDASLFVTGNVGIGTTSASSSLHVAGGTSYKWNLYTATSSITTADHFVGVSSTVPITLYLPHPTSTPSGGFEIIVKDENGNGASNTYTVAPTSTSAALIDGASSASITTNYGSLRLYNNGVNWFTY